MTNRSDSAEHKTPKNNNTPRFHQDRPKEKQEGKVNYHTPKNIAHHPTALTNLTREKYRNSPSTQPIDKTTNYPFENHQLHLPSHHTRNVVYERFADVRKIRRCAKDSQTLEGSLEDSGRDARYNVDTRSAEGGIHPTLGRVSRTPRSRIDKKGSFISSGLGSPPCQTAGRRS